MSYAQSVMFNLCLKKLWFWGCSFSQHRQSWLYSHIFISTKCERSEYWKRLRDWSFCPFVCVSIIISLGGDMHSYERLLVGLILTLKFYHHKLHAGRSLLMNWLKYAKTILMDTMAVFASI